MFKTLEELITVIRQRKESSTEESYTKKLLNNKKLSFEKVKEEIAELIDSIEKNSNKVHESFFEDLHHKKLKQTHLHKFFYKGFHLLKF